MTKTQTQDEDDGGRRRSWELALWLAVLVAFLPTLHDLLGHWLRHSWSRYSLGFLPLLLLAIRADRRPSQPRRGLALALIALCLLGQILASLASLIHIARPFVGVALVGLLLHGNRVRPRTALLAVFLVPAPGVLVSHWLAGDALAPGLAEAAAGALNGLGAGAEVSGPLLWVGDRQLEVQPHWGGALLALQGLGVAWYYAARRELAVGATALAMLAAALMAIPFQLAMLVASGLVLWAGEAAVAGALLDPGSWLFPLLAALYLGEIRQRAEHSHAAAGRPTAASA